MSPGFSLSRRSSYIVNFRARAQRLEWRQLLEARLQGLRDLKPSVELEWDYDPGADEDGRAAKRLIRDLDVLPAGDGAGSFASLFPFFLSNAGQTRFIQLLTKPVTELVEVRRRQMAIEFWEKRVVLRRKNSTNLGDARGSARHLVVKSSCSVHSCTERFGQMALVGHRRAGLVFRFVGGRGFRLAKMDWHSRSGFVARLLLHRLSPYRSVCCVSARDAAW